MHRLSSLGGRSFRRSFGRYVLTVAGTALGVAVLVGVLTANETTSRMLSRNFGGADHGVVIEPAGAYGADIDAAALERAVALPGVGEVFGNIWFRAMPSGVEPEPGSELWVVANDHREGSAPFERNEESDAGQFRGRRPAAGAEEVAMSSSAAQRLGVDLGGTVELAVPAGPVSAAVVGIWPRGNDSGVATSLSTARRWAGKGEVYDNLYVRLGDDVEVDRWIAEHGDAIGVGLRARPSQSGLSGLRSVVRLTQAAFAGIASTAVFVGAFLAYLTLSTAAIERRRLHGTLRALGAGRGQIMRLVLAEAAVLAVSSTAVGLLLGVGIARLMVRFVSGLYELGSPSVVVSPGVLALGIVVGVGVTLLAALVPALRASRITPVDAIRGTVGADVRLSRAWLAGCLLMAMGLLFALSPRTDGFELTTLLVLLGAVFVVPPLLRPVARFVGQLTRRLSRGVGDAAVMHLVKERSRSAYTLGLVMVVLAMVFAVLATRASFLTTLDRMFARTFGGDVTVYGDQIDTATQAQILSAPGVGASTSYRFGSTRVGPAEVQLLIIEPESYFEFQSFWWIDGSDDRVREELAAGSSVMLPEALAERLGAARGESVSLETAIGPQEFRVAGVYATLEPEARVVTGVVDGREWFRADLPDALVLKAADGVSPDRLLTAVRERARGHADLEVLSVDDERSVAADRINRNFSAFLAVVLVAAVVGLLGLANTLGMTVLQRTREIGVLRSVGVQRAQLRAMVLVESLTLVATAGVLAVPLGLLLSAVIVGSSGRALGVLVEYVFPWAAVPVLLLVAAAIAGLAALMPARRAARIDPVVALRFE